MKTSAAEAHGRGRMVCCLLPILAVMHCCLGHSVASSDESVDDGRTIHLGGIFPLSGGWGGGAACLPACKLAVADINADPNLLTGYNLSLEETDSRCDPGVGLANMYDLLYQSSHTKLLLLTGCSSVSTLVAEASRMWNLLVLSYGSSSPALSDRERFPTFFRTHPSAILHNPTRVALMKKYGWTKVAIIEQIEEVFTSTMEDLEGLLEKNGIAVSVVESFQTDPSEAVYSLQNHDVRIIFGAFYEDMARKVFCEAYKLGMYGPKYQWFILGWYPDNWYNKSLPNEHLDCTAGEIQLAAQYHMTTEVLMLRPNRTAPTELNGITAEQFIERLDTELAEHPSRVSGYMEAPLAYDAMWALAFALNKTMARLPLFKPEEFSYEREDMTRDLMNEMNQIRFEGVSGLVKFEAGDRIAKIKIEQLQGDEYITLGYYDSNKDHMKWEDQELWPGNNPPQDSTFEETVIRSVSAALYFTMATLCLLTIAMAMACLLFNFWFWHSQVVKSSMPEMNSLSVVGSILCLSSIFVLLQSGQPMGDKYFSSLCQVRVWMMSVGYTLGIGPLAVKLFYVYRVTSQTQPYSNGSTGIGNSRVLPPANQVIPVYLPRLVLAAMVAFDLVLVLCQSIYDPYRREVYEFPLEEIPRDDPRDVMIRPLLELCLANTVWTEVLLFGWKCMIGLSSLYLAYETRNAKLAEVNDSRYTALSVCNVLILCLIVVPVTRLIPKQHNATFVFNYSAVILSSWLTLGLLFAPKVALLVRKGEEVEWCGRKSKASSNQNAAGYNCESKGLLSGGEGESEVYGELEREHVELEKILAEKEENVRELRRMVAKRVKSQPRSDGRHGSNSLNPNGSQTSDSAIISGNTSAAELNPKKED